MSHIPPGVTKKRGIGFMDVMDFAIKEDDAKRKKVIMHYAMRELQKTENELQDAVKCSKVAKVAKERAVKRAQDAENCVKVLKVVFDDKDALRQQLEVAEKRAQALQQQLKVTEERAQVAEKPAQVYEEISNARSAQAFTSFTKRRRDEEWKDIVHGPGFNEILLTVAPITKWPKVSSLGRYQPPDGSGIKDLRWCGEVYVNIFGRKYLFSTLVARAFLGKVPNGSVGVAYRHGEDNSSHNLEYMVAPASVQEPVCVPTPDEDGSCTPSREYFPYGPNLYAQEPVCVLTPDEDGSCTPSREYFPYAPASVQEPVCVPTPDEDGSCTPSRGAAPVLSSGAVLYYAQ